MPPIRVPDHQRGQQGAIPIQLDGSSLVQPRGEQGSPHAAELHVAVGAWRERDVPHVHGGAVLGHRREAGELHRLAWVDLTRMHQAELEVRLQLEPARFFWHPEVRVEARGYGGRAAGEDSHDEVERRLALPCRDDPLDLLHRRVGVVVERQRHAALVAGDEGPVTIGGGAVDRVQRLVRHQAGPLGGSVVAPPPGAEGQPDEIARQHPQMADDRRILDLAEPRRAGKWLERPVRQHEAAVGEHRSGADDGRLAVRPAQLM